MSTAVRLSRGVAWMTLGNWSEQTVNLAVFVVLVRLLGAETFGVLTMAMAFVLVAEGLVRETASELLFSASGHDKRLPDALFWGLLGLGALLTLTLILGAPAIATLYDMPQVAALLWLLAPIPLLTGVTAVPVAILRQRMEIRPLAARAFYGVVAGGIVGIALALAGAGIWALAAQRLVLTLVNVVMAWRAARWRPGPWPGWPALLKHRAFVRDMLTYRAAEMGNLQMPAIAIGVALGPVALGYYTLAWRIVELATFLIVTPVRTTALAAFVDGDPEHTPQLLLDDTLRLTGFITIPAFAGIAVTAPEVLHLFGGAAWRPAADCLSVLAIFGMFLCLAKVEETFVLARGRSRDLARIALVNLTLLLGLLWVTSSYELIGMTAGVVVAAAITAPMRTGLVARASRRPLYSFYRQQAGPVFAALVMAAVLGGLAPWFDRLPPPVSLALTGAIGAAIYIGIALLKMRRRIAMARSYLAGLRRGGHEPIAVTEKTDHEIS